MANDINSISITGRLGADPDLKFFNGGEAILNLRVAVAQQVKNKAGEWVDEPVWITVTVWGKRAEGFAKIVRKGSRIGADGRLRVRQYERNDGTKGTSVELVANNVVPLDPKPQDGSQQQSSGQRSQGGSSSGSRSQGSSMPPDDAPPFDDSDLPF